MRCSLDSGSIIDDGVACRLAEGAILPDRHHRPGPMPPPTACSLAERPCGWVSNHRRDRPPSPRSTSPARWRAHSSRAVRATSISRPRVPLLAVRGDRRRRYRRFLRVGFVGELGYEIHVPATTAKHYGIVLIEAGRIRHQAVWRRGAAAAAPGEGTHHRRPGHGRPDDALRGNLAWALPKSKSQSGASPHRRRARRGVPTA